ncbi:hypothetical protein AVEN_148303-1 [Araneus ventricosus]|uniref:Uncharacterized protein n=1 Tax=Araneus ventricosus TaxID=182803 RepID=A0A4Y2WD76_ARAVE|nr:hypothetical protein AVEN_148303-1 [Araneus ventricosus]
MIHYAIASMDDEPSALGEDIVKSTLPTVLIFMVSLKPDPQSSSEMFELAAQHCQSSSEGSALAGQYSQSFSVALFLMLLYK